MDGVRGDLGDPFRRRWLLGSLLCSWVAMAIILANIILAVVGEPPLVPPILFELLVLAEERDNEGAGA